MICLKNALGVEERKIANCVAIGLGRLPRGNPPFSFLFRPTLSFSFYKRKKAIDGKKEN